MENKHVIVSPRNRFSNSPFVLYRVLVLSMTDTSEPENARDTNSTKKATVIGIWRKSSLCQRDELYQRRREAIRMRNTPMKVNLLLRQSARAFYHNWLKAARPADRKEPSRPCLSFIFSKAIISANYHLAVSQNMTVFSLKISKTSSSHGKENQFPLKLFFTPNRIICAGIFDEIIDWCTAQVCVCVYTRFVKSERFQWQVKNKWENRSL